ncbi:MAG: heavy metal translocating P-type ATPase, partial [Lachnospiraceae bacterium]|nr:heavy metal translocating P-type ATPase [Lachnospiraceae bacterium]
HDHEHEHHHRKEQTPNPQEDSEKKEKYNLAAGIILAIIAYIAGYFMKDENMSLIVYLAAYLFLAKNIIITAVHNIGKGQIFDENFLMTIATIGALLIGEYPEALGVILFYRIGEAFEDYAVEKSRASIMETVNMRPETVLQVHGDHTHEIPAEDVTPGTIILVRPGDRIPLDGIVIEGTTQLDTSALTGEPVPVTVTEGDEILSGCLNQIGVIKLKVTNTLDESMVTRIMESMENAAASKPQMERFITRFSHIYTPFVVAVALATAIIPSLITGEWSRWIYTACTFLVISCPCALVLSVPLSFFSGIGLGSKKGILFKGGIALEALKDVKAVVMDKTGTITEGNFVLQSILTCGNGSENELLSYAAACEQNSTHPIAKSILTAAKERQISVMEASEIEEIAGHGMKALINGSEILCGNKKLMDRFGIEIPHEAADYGTEILLAKNQAYAGRLLISDTLKDDSRESIEKLNQSVQTVMLTGDSADSAKAIAEKTGIKEYYAKLLPNDKLDVLQKLREKYGSVMFVGDGINDAPVLAGADCGAAMGSGADAAIEAADVVFMTSRLSAIPEAIRIAKMTNRIATQNIVFALAFKALVLILGLLGIASMWMAVFADTGVAVICIINSIRVLRK